MNRNKTLKVILLVFSSIASWIVSDLYTINLAMSFFSIVAIAIIIGIFIDAIKVYAIMESVDSKSVFWTITAILFINLSIFATLGALQTKLEKSAQESPEYLAKEKTIEDLDAQIRNKRAVAQRQLEINHVTRSDRTNREIDELISKRNNENNELLNMRVTASGVTGAIFRAFSRLFKLSLYHVVVIGNLLFSIFIELVGVLSYYGLWIVSGKVKTTYRKSISVEYNPKIEVDSDNGKIEVARPVGFNIGEILNSKSSDSLNSNNRDELNFSSGDNSQNLNSDLNGDNQNFFERSKENLNSSGDNSTTINNIKLTKIDINRINRLYEKSGKTDSAIIYLYFNKGIRNKSLIGRLVGEHLNNKRDRVSCTYVSRVINDYKRKLSKVDVI